jgi:hypothetical protein
MRLIIIPYDKFVSIDGYGIHEIDLSNIDPSVHAVQWYDTHGEIEIKDLETGRIATNVKITSIEQFQFAIDAWNAAKTEIEQTLNNNQQEQIL